MFATITSGAILGIKSYLVQVEVNASGGLPCFAMVGFLAGEVKEAGERVRVALRNTGITIPPLHITVNLSPAHVRKEGTAFDLPIAAGILVATGCLRPQAAEHILLIGELGLNGIVKKVNGILPIVREAVRRGVSHFVVPSENVREAAAVPGANICGVGTLQEVVAFMSADESERSYTRLELPEIRGSEMPEDDGESLDYADIIGQEQAKRAAVIAAAGFHHLLLVGPPGTGKTMLARRLPTILPPLTREESLEVTSLYSIAGILNPEAALLTKRPFLNPHYTITEQALTGGGRIPKPGVVSLAHLGVLFMDELPECKRTVIEILRQPIEDKTVSISRAQGTYTYPADFLFIGAMNPCPCGYFPALDKCSCSEQAVRHYLSRISGPILDRIDICTEVAQLEPDRLQRDREEISSRQMREQIEAARNIQRIRYAGSTCRGNADIKARDIPIYCHLNDRESALMAEIFTTMKLSTRAYHRILKVARTIADLEASGEIAEKHLLEAVHFRLNDRKYWR